MSTGRVVSEWRWVSGVIYDRSERECLQDGSKTSYTVWPGDGSVKEKTEGV